MGKPVPRPIVLACLERAGYACEHCRLPTEAAPHHKKYRSRGGSNAAVNLALLCVACHERAHDGDPQLARFRTARWQNEGESEADI